LCVCVCVCVCVCAHYKHYNLSRYLHIQAHKHTQQVTDDYYKCTLPPDLGGGDNTKVCLLPLSCLSFPLLPLASPNIFALTDIISVILERFKGGQNQGLFEFTRCCADLTGMRARFKHALMYARATARTRYKRGTHVNTPSCAHT
jgi:hypothetical protein